MGHARSTPQAGVLALQLSAQRDGTRRGDGATPTHSQTIPALPFMRAPPPLHPVPTPHADGTRRSTPQAGVRALQLSAQWDGTQRRIECVRNCTSMPTFFRLESPAGRRPAAGRPTGRRRCTPHAIRPTGLTCMGAAGLVRVLHMGLAPGGFTTSPL